MARGAIGGGVGEDEDGDGDGDEKVVAHRKMTSAWGRSYGEMSGRRGETRRSTYNLYAVAGSAAEVDADDTVGSPLAFAGETVDAEDVGHGGADAAALEVQPVERGGRVGAVGGHGVGGGGREGGGGCGVGTRGEGRTGGRGGEGVGEERDGRAGVLLADGADGERELLLVVADVVLGGEDGA